MRVHAQIVWWFPKNFQQILNNEKTTKNVLAEYQENYLFPSTAGISFCYCSNKMRQVCAYLSGTFMHVYGPFAKLLDKGKSKHK